MAHTLEEYLDSFRSCDVSMVIQYETVVNLDQATKRLKSNGIDVNLLDVNLPNSQGAFSVLRLFASSPTVPIVVLTGDDCGELEEKCIKSGAQDFIRKSDLAGMKVLDFVRRLWHAVLRASRRSEVIQKFFPVEQEIEKEKKEIQKVIDDSVNVPKE